MPEENSAFKEKPPLIECKTRMRNLEYGTLIKANGKKYKIRDKSRNYTLMFIYLIGILLTIVFLYFVLTS